MYKTWDYKYERSSVTTCSGTTVSYLLPKDATWGHEAYFSHTRHSVMTDIESWQKSLQEFSIPTHHFYKEL